MLAELQRRKTDRDGRPARSAAACVDVSIPGLGTAACSKKTSIPVILATPSPTTEPLSRHKQMRPTPGQEHRRMVNNKTIGRARVVLSVGILFTMLSQIRQADAEITDSDILAGFCRGAINQQVTYNRSVGFYEPNAEYQLRRVNSYLFSRGYMDPSKPGFLAILASQNQRAMQTVDDCGKGMMDVMNGCELNVQDTNKCMARRQLVPACRALDKCDSLDSLPP